MAYEALVIPPPPAPNYARTHSIYAGFWIRVLAYSVDTLVLFALGVVLSPFLHLPTPSLLLPPFVLPPIPSLLLAILYFGLFWSRFAGGATPGMRVFGLRVVDASGSPVGLLHALLRAVFLSLSFFLYLGVLWVAIDPKKQGWHDKLARTYVLRR